MCVCLVYSTGGGGISVKLSIQDNIILQLNVSKKREICIFLHQCSKNLFADRLSPSSRAVTSRAHTPAVLW